MEPITMGIIALLSAIGAIGTSAVQNSYNTRQVAETNKTNIELTKIANDSQMQQVQEANAFASAEAQKARDYDMYMSNTQVQRAMADYQAAGLNPLLAATNGATYNAPASADASLASIKAASAKPAQLDLSGVTSAISSMTSLLLVSKLFKNLNLKDLLKREPKNGGFLEI